MFAEIFIMIYCGIFNYHLQVVALQVIWAIGLSIGGIVVLQFLPYKILLAIGLLIVAGHNLLDSISVEHPF